MQTAYSPARKWHASRWLVLVVVVLGLGACGSSGSASESAPVTVPGDETTTSEAPPTTTTNVEAAILAAYQEFWRVWLKATNPPNPNDPDLARVAAGAELDAMRQAIGKKVVEGIFTRLPDGSRYRHDARVLGVDATGVARVSDCAFDDAQQVRASSGEVVNGEVATQRIAGVLQANHSHWQVVSIHIEEQHLGEVACG